MNSLKLINSALVSINFEKINIQNYNVNELVLLSKSAGFYPIIKIISNKDYPDASLFIGSGKTEELRIICEKNNIKIVIFNNNLTSSQQRNLEKSINVHVIDRTDLILDIFAKRARSHAGKLQVELARMQYLSTRLIRAWTHLERQKGGIGIRGGPGETQLECDRRLIGNKIKILQKKINKLQSQYYIQRNRRKRNRVISISLVGYTNSGKSTIFNALTKSQEYTSNKVFSTLDTISRKIYLNNIIGEIIISDTVGFIQNLPCQLIKAFHATLEETIHADLLLHIVDISNDMHINQINEVNSLLNQIKANTMKKILIFNKIDAIKNNKSAKIERDENKKIKFITLSAKLGIGLNLLRKAIIEIIDDK